MHFGDRDVTDVHPSILLQTWYLEQFFVQIYLSLGAPHGRIPCALLHEFDKFTRSTETLPVWPESDGDVRRDLVSRCGDGWGLDLAHVVCPILPINLLTVADVDVKFRTEYVGQLGAVAVATTRHALLLVVVVGAGQKVPKDELGDPDGLSVGALFSLVFLDWDRYSVVSNMDKVLARHDFNLRNLLGVHRILIDGVDQNLIEDFYQCRANRKLRKLETLPISNPIGGRFGREGSDISVGTFEDMLHM